MHQLGAPEWNFTPPFVILHRLEFPGKGGFPLQGRGVSGEGPGYRFQLLQGVATIHTDSDIILGDTKTVHTEEHL